MNTQNRDTLGFGIGMLFSLVSHLLLAAGWILFLESSSFGSEKMQTVFSVTLEGGDRLGGINQAPEPNAKEQKVLPNQQEATEESQAEEAEEKKTSEELTQTTVVEDKTAEIAAKKALEEKKLAEAAKKKAELEKLKKEEQKKKEEELKKKEEAEAKKKAEELKKKQSEDEKKKSAEEKKARDAKLKRAIASAAKRYSGESANAGGEGFGAAALGGKGMGGGTLQSLEFVAYRNALENHIKSGWRWLPGPQRYKAVALVSILPTGIIQDVRIAESSGNPSFDDSVLRAVQKASPVPAAPPQLYEQFFREIRITFDSQE